MREVEDKLDALRRVLKETEREVSSPRIKRVMKSIVPSFRDPDEINRTANDTPEMKAANEQSAANRAAEVQSDTDRPIPVGVTASEDSEGGDES